MQCCCSSSHPHLALAIFTELPRPSPLAYSYPVSSCPFCFALDLFSHTGSRYLGQYAGIKSKLDHPFTAADCDRYGEHGWILSFCSLWADSWEISFVEKSFGKGYNLVCPSKTATSVRQFWWQRDLLVEAFLWWVWGHLLACSPILLRDKLRALVPWYRGFHMASVDMQYWHPITSSS